jgi:hypothetical protein
MNLILHDFSRFKGFAMSQATRPEFRFLRNVLQTPEILGSAANVTALHSLRMSLQCLSISTVSSPVSIDRAHDYPEWIEQREALSRFEWEGGRAENCPCGRRSSSGFKPPALAGVAIKQLSHRFGRLFQIECCGQTKKNH